MAKGSQFERDICKLLSRWWSRALCPEERDDIFWRTSQSGGRATMRARKGLRTYGSYGDVSAVDPIGAPLLKVFSVELKRGRSHGTPEDLLDLSPGSAIRPFERTMQQVLAEWEGSRALYWLLIVRKDRRDAVAYLPRNALALLQSKIAMVPHVRYSLPLRLLPGKPPSSQLFYGCRLEDLLDLLCPRTVCSVARKL